MQVCQEALELNGRLISSDQHLYHDDLKTKYQQMEDMLAPYLNSPEVCVHLHCVIFCSYLVC